MAGSHVTSIGYVTLLVRFTVGAGAIVLLACAAQEPGARPGCPVDVDAATVPRTKGDAEHCAPGECGEAEGGAVEVGLPNGWDADSTPFPVFDPKEPRLDFCSNTCPCGVGEGSCDDDSECRLGLICGEGNGPLAGLSEGIDTCRWSTQLLFWAQDVKASAFPEGSIASIENAYDLGYDGVEIDLQMTRDERLVLMHDYTLEGATNGTGALRSMSLEEVQQYQLLPVQEPPVPIATLEEALLANGSRGVFLADVKNRSDAIGALQAAVDASGFATERLIISAYGVEEAVRFRDAFPGVRVLVKSHDYPEAISEEAVEAVDAAEVAGMMMKLPSDLTTVEPLLQRLHERGLILVLFVQGRTGSIEDLQTMSAMGLDYVLTRNDSAIR